MIVCVCNNISEGKIHQAVNVGMTSMSELRKELGVGTGCGKCHACAKHVLRECLGNAKQTPCKPWYSTRIPSLHKDHP